MKLKNETYDCLKWIISIVLPALTVLVQTIGQAVGWGGTDLTVTVLTAVTTFLGAVFMVSSNTYQKEHISVPKDSID